MARYNGLQLTRKVGEQIIIGNDIIVTVTSFGRGKQSVSLNIHAPKNLRIDRMEIHEKRKASLDVDDVDDAGSGGLI